MCFVQDSVNFSAIGFTFQESIHRRKDAKKHDRHCPIGRETIISEVHTLCIQRQVAKPHVRIAS